MTKPRKPLLVPVSVRDRKSIAHSAGGHYGKTFEEVQAARDELSAAGKNPGWGPEGIMMEVAPFTEKLRFVGFRLDGKTYHSQWVGVDGARYPMFLADMDDLIKNTTLVDGAMIAEDTFETCKKSNAYGIRLI